MSSATPVPPTCWTTGRTSGARTATACASPAASRSPRRASRPSRRLERASTAHPSAEERTPLASVNRGARQYQGIAVLLLIVLVYIVLSRHVISVDTLVF